MHAEQAKSTLLSRGSLFTEKPRLIAAESQNCEY